jgi:caa(3)-type oxidase subunit IV
MSVSLYLKVFSILFVLIFVNIGIAKLPFLDTTARTILCLSVSFVQATIMVLFFMELIHESRFFLFIVLSTILFVSLFMSVTLMEVHTRGVFSYLEDAKFMRQVDEQGNFAPNMPKK